MVLRASESHKQIKNDMKNRAEQWGCTHAFNPSTLGGRGRQISEFEASLGLQSEFQYSQGYTEKPCLGVGEVWVLFWHICACTTCV